MTPTQHRALAFIRDQLDTTGVAPTYEAMAAHLGVSSKGRAHDLVTRLVDQGLLVRIPGLRRGLRLAGADLRAASTADLRAELTRRKRPA